MRLDQLEIADRLAELLALARIRHAFADQPLGDADADGGDVQPSAIEHLHGDLEALALLAQTQARWHARIVEDHVADMGALLAHLLFGLADAMMPGVFAGTMKAEMPAAPFFAGSVRASSVNMPARSALVMKRLVPLTT